MHVAIILGFYLYILCFEGNDVDGEPWKYNVFAVWKIYAPQFKKACVLCNMADYVITWNIHEFFQQQF